MPGGSQQQTTVAGAGTICIWIFGIGLMNFLLGAVLNATLDLPTRLSYIREASRPSKTPQRTARGRARGELASLVDMIPLNF